LDSNQQKLAVVDYANFLLFVGLRPVCIQHVMAQCVVAAAVCFVIVDG
jgi:hypothetical protein